MNILFFLFSIFFLLLFPTYQIQIRGGAELGPPSHPQASAGPLLRVPERACWELQFPPTRQSREVLRPWALEAREARSLSAVPTDTHQVSVLTPPHLTFCFGAFAWAVPPSPAWKTAPKAASGCTSHNHN